MSDKIDTARQISLGINTLERRGAESMTRSVAFVSSLLTARDEHRMPAHFATGAISKAAAALKHIADANHALAECHRELAADRIEFGVSVMVGDNFPCPTLHDRSVPAALSTGWPLQAVA